MGEKIIEMFMQHGITGAMLLIGLWYYVTKIVPRLEAREKERDLMINQRVLTADNLHSDRIKEMIEDRRESERLWAERETTLRREHAEAWEIHREQAREDRIADREMFKEMTNRVAEGFDKLIGNQTMGFKELKVGQDRNFNLSISVAERMGQSKSELVDNVERLTGAPVADKHKYDTQAPDRQPNGSSKL